MIDQNQNFMEASSFFLWKQDDVDSLNSFKEFANLNWPKGVVEILQLAFEKNLPRNQGWDISQIHKNWQPAFEVAASVFRRGVQLKRGETFSLKLQHEFELHKIIFNENIAPFIGEISRELDWHVLVDKKVFKAWPELKIVCHIECVEVSEACKDLAFADHLAGSFRRSGKKTIAIIGGGVLLDVAGFAASMAGCETILIPTTLLAMADASIGGKTGVNFPPFGKNQIGSYHFPAKIFICRQWLETLPVEEFNSGIAECLKHAFLSGDQNLAFDLVLDAKKQMLTSANLASVVSFKQQIVDADPAECGKRAVLNFGHTLGHALESLSDGVIRHGHAVALGMIYAGLVSMDVGGLARRDFDMMRDLLERAGCLPKVDSMIDRPNAWDQILGLMRQDKKVISEKAVSMVLFKSFGQIFQNETGSYVAQVSEPQLKKSWQQFCSIMRGSRL